METVLLGSHSHLGEVHHENWARRYWRKVTANHIKTLLSLLTAQFLRTSLVSRGVRGGMRLSDLGVRACDQKAV